MPTENNGDWVKIVGLILAVTVPLIGVVFGLTKSNIDRNAKDIITLQIKTESIDKTVARVEERVIFISTDVKDVNETVKKIRDDVNDIAREVGP